MRESPLRTPSHSRRSLWVIGGLVALLVVLWLSLGGRDEKSDSAARDERSSVRVSQARTRGDASARHRRPLKALDRTESGAAAEVPPRHGSLAARSPSAFPTATAAPRIVPPDLDLPWRHPGMCADGSVGREQKRAAYLAGFVEHPAWRTVLNAHPEVPEWAVQRVTSFLGNIHSGVSRRLGLNAEPPRIFVYPTVEALRAHSCASASAVAYYDGAIHLALVEPAYGIPPAHDGPDDLRSHELSKSLQHEYVHHVLVSNGIGKPIWFQEGAAMTIAGDQPRNYWRIWREHPINLRQMVDGFPAGGEAPAPGSFYAQAYAMTEFLERLCLKLKPCGLPELTAALKTGRATPVTLFDWAISERASDLVRTSRLPLWDDYVARGDFAPETLHSLLHRPDPSRTP